VERAGTVVDGIVEAGGLEAQWISFKDDTPLARGSRETSPAAARHYRKEFAAAKEVKRALLYGSGARAREFHLNGKRVAMRISSPAGRTYRQRVHLPRA
jgi:alpha-L-rhamnosidase